MARLLGFLLVLALVAVVAAVVYVYFADLPPPTRETVVTVPGAKLDE